MQWRIELFGGLRAISSERVIERFQTQQTGALLAYLAFHLDRRQPREVLFELLWPECDPRAGRNSLSVALSSLRHQLEPPGVPQGAVIIADRASVRLNPATVTTDAAEFEAALARSNDFRRYRDAERIQHLADAVELYRGELLSGYYENWILFEAQRLSELFFRALRGLIENLEHAGDLHRALDYAQRGVTIDPLREEVHYELIRLYDVIGQPTAALRQYAELERILREQFDDTPAAATRELARLIESGGQGSEGGRRKAEGGRRKAKGKRQKEDIKQQAEVGQQPVLIPHPSSLIPHPSPPARLPLQLTRFFGREAEIAHLTEMLLEGVAGWRVGELVNGNPPTHQLTNPPFTTRLVTLTGPGGSGKTRLAVEVAGRLMEEFDRAVWFVPLADISDPQLIADTILDALRLPRSPNVEPLEQVVEFLSRQPALLILDNMEHLLDDREWKMENGKWKAETTQSILHSPFSILHALLGRVPTLKVLVTSRQVLGLTGEREFAVPPLPTPNGGTPTPEWLIRCESVQLFVDRAQAVKPDFQVTPANAAAVAELCERLEGIPLAIELAAARAQVFTVAQMVAQLENRFDFLMTRRRDVAERHRTLRAALEWSYRLLTPELQRFFASLSVFRGGWTLEAAEAVSTDFGSGLNGFIPSTPLPNPLNPLPKSVDTDVLDYLAQLRECSLILTEKRAGEMRFRMLDTLREYAWEQLTEPEQGQVQQRHASYFLRFAEQRAVSMRTRDETRALDELETEVDNLRAAMQFVVSHAAQFVVSHAVPMQSGRSGVETALHSVPCLTTNSARLALALYELLYRRGFWTEAQRYLEAVRSLAPCGRLHHALASLAHDMGNLMEARAQAEASLALCRELNDPNGIADALNLLGVIACRESDFSAAWQFFEDALNRLTDSDSTRCGIVLHNFAFLSARCGDVDTARRFYEQALRHRRAAGDARGEAETLSNLGVLAHNAGDHARAYRLYHECLSLYRALRYPYGIAVMLNNLGELAEADGDWSTAVILYVHAERILRDLHSADVRAPAESLQRVAEQLGEERFAALRQAAEETAWEEVVDGEAE